jgi:hypothetical protein
MMYFQKWSQLVSGAAFNVRDAAIFVADASADVCCATFDLCGGGAVGDNQQGKQENCD